MLKIKKIEMDALMAYRYKDSATHTPSPVVNAVMDILSTTSVRSVSLLATLLDVDGHKLSCAIEIETGMTLRTLIVQYNLRRIRGYMQRHPEQKQREVAAYFRFSSLHALWLFFLRADGTTPGGRVSRAPKVDRYTQRRREIHRQYGRHRVPRPKKIPLCATAMFEALPLPPEVT